MDPHQFGNLDPDPHPHEKKIPDPHPVPYQSDNLDPEPKCLEYEAILALLQGFEPLFGS
jgi:hypothetical protein